MDYWRSAALATLAVGLVACPNKDKDDDKIKPAPSATVPAAVSSTPAVDVPAKLTIVPRVKAELDGRADGITGTPSGSAALRYCSTSQKSFGSSWEYISINSFKQGFCPRIRSIRQKPVTASSSCSVPAWPSSMTTSGSTDTAIKANCNGIFMPIGARSPSP